MINHLPLPDGWRWASVAELAADEPRAITDGPFGSNLKTAHYTTEGPRVIRLQNIGDGAFLDAEAHISHERFAELRSHEARAGDVVVASLGEVLPRACLVPPALGPAIVKADCARIRPASDVDAGYLMHALNSRVVRDQAARSVHGVGRQRLRLAELKKLLVPVPPPDEQRRLRALLDDRLIRIEAGLATLDRARANLAVFRESLFAAAVDGRLRSLDETPADELRLAALERRLERDTSSKRKTKRPLGGRRDHVPFDLPNGWSYASIDELATSVQYGSSAKTSEEPRGVPVLRMGNVTLDGRIRWNGLKYLPADHEDFPSLLLADGDLLFNRTNSPALVGKSAVVRNMPWEASFASYLIRVRFDEAIVPEFAAFYLASSYGRGWVRSVVSQQVGQANVNGTKLKQLTIPLPPPETQRAIVEAAGRYLSAADELEARLDASRPRAAQLRASALAQTIVTAAHLQDDAQLTA